MKHLNYSGEEILETIHMVRAEQLDIRTITVGISLLDCVSDTPEGLCRNIYDKVTSRAVICGRWADRSARNSASPLSITGCR